MGGGVGKFVCLGFRLKMRLDRKDFVSRLVSVDFIWEVVGNFEGVLRREVIRLDLCG